MGRPVQQFIADYWEQVGMATSEDLLQGVIERGGPAGDFPFLLAEPVHGSHHRTHINVQGVLSPRQKAAIALAIQRTPSVLVIAVHDCWISRGKLIPKWQSPDQKPTQQQAVALDVTMGAQRFIKACRYTRANGRAQFSTYGEHLGMDLPPWSQPVQRSDWTDSEWADIEEQSRTLAAGAGLDAPPPDPDEVEGSRPLGAQCPAPSLVH